MHTDAPSQSLRQRFLGRHLQGSPGLSLQSPDEMLQSSLGFWNGNCFGEDGEKYSRPSPRRHHRHCHHHHTANTSSSSKTRKRQRGSKGVYLCLRSSEKPNWAQLLASKFGHLWALTGRLEKGSWGLWLAQKPDKPQVLNRRQLCAQNPSLSLSLALPSQPPFPFLPLFHY